jgi:heme exporter protein A
VRGYRRLFTGLSLAVDAGEMLWVQGPNGSGKTSLLRLLCGLARPERGTVLWRGEDIRGNREGYYNELLYGGHAAALKDDLSALENVRYGALTTGLAVAHQQARNALSDLGLAGFEDIPARVLSQGQRRRVSLARLALADGKQIWILDEPFTALDAAATGLVQSFLAGHLLRGGSIVFTSHQEIDLGPVRVTRLRLDA